MAKGNTGTSKTVTKKVNYILVHKLAAAVSLLAFAVILASGIMAEARVITIAYRALVVILAVSLISRIVISILSTYEEIDRG